MNGENAMNMREARSQFRWVRRECNESDEDYQARNATVGSAVSMMVFAAMFAIACFSLAAWLLSGPAYALIPIGCGGVVVFIGGIIVLVSKTLA